jgi:hypothetical protein
MVLACMWTLEVVAARAGMPSTRSLAMLECSSHQPVDRGMKRNATLKGKRKVLSQHI